MGHSLTDETIIGLPGVCSQSGDVVSQSCTTLINSSPRTKSANGTAEQPPLVNCDTRPRLLIWSSPDQKGAERLGVAFHEYLGKPHPDSELDNLAYAMAARRSQFSWRSFAVVNSHTPDTSRVLYSNPVRTTSRSPRVAFVFTGQGAQYLGMGRDLVAFPEFRSSLHHCDKILKMLGCQWSLVELICKSSSCVDIDSPDRSQPLTTCLQIALVDLLRSLGIAPSVVLGHSSGEIAAAYASGALSRDAAVKVAYHRGVLSSRLINDDSKGLSMMMAVGISTHDVTKYLKRLESSAVVLKVQVGCVNSPQSITLTGNPEQLTTIERWLMDDGVFTRKLRVPIAYHSGFMKQIAGDYGAAIEDLQMGHCSRLVPMISSVSGDIVMALELTSPEYWVSNLTSTVQFDAAFTKLLGLANRKPRRQLGKRKAIADSFGPTHVLEVGPHGALRGPIRDILQSSSAGATLEYIPSLTRGEDASASILRAVGTLYSAGFKVNLLRANLLEEAARPMPTDMPKYPFNHSQLYWKESSLSRNLRFGGFARHDLLGTRSLDWNARIAQWRNIIRLAELPW